MIRFKPKEFTAQQEKALEILSHQLMKLLESRKSTILLHQNNKRLRISNKALNNFVTIAAHDIKSPINNIVSLSEMLLEDYTAIMEPDAEELIKYIHTSALHSTQLVDGILSYSKDVNGISDHKETVHIKKLLLDIKQILVDEDLVQMIIEVDDHISVFANRTALHQIFSNLINNSIKYNHNEEVKIHIKAIDNGDTLKFRVADNGPGIKPKDKKRIFKLFSTTINKDRNGFHGTGIGLATVKNLVEHLGGKISVISPEGKGAIFRFTIQKTPDFIPVLNH
jgi:signal transduction histidine kinase